LIQPLTVALIKSGTIYLDNDVCKQDGNLQGWLMTIHIEGWLSFHGACCPAYPGDWTACYM